MFEISLKVWPWPNNFGEFLRRVDEDVAEAPVALETEELNRAGPFRPGANVIKLFCP